MFFGSYPLIAPGDQAELLAQAARFRAGSPEGMEISEPLQGVTNSLRFPNPTAAATIYAIE
jgi:hypothetical protein